MRVVTVALAIGFLVVSYIAWDTHRINDGLKNINGQAAAEITVLEAETMVHRIHVNKLLNEIERLQNELDYMKGLIPECPTPNKELKI